MSPLYCPVRLALAPVQPYLLVMPLDVHHDDDDEDLSQDVHDDDVDDDDTTRCVY